ncbi:hypothetical protein LCGC14_1566070 [marine sediment metagenome]|uniref:SpoVT-AbrB domain-containing protein n=1 Tax=marine sediment metagenome TaxID=412755 RepID=A0A0F9L1Z9_9ZZZZ
MNGHPVKYLFYESNKKSIVTIPRAILEANNFNWDHKEEINLVVKTIDGQKGIFLYKKDKIEKRKK